MSDICEIISYEGELKNSDVQGKVGDTLFNVWNKNSGRASISLRILKRTQLLISSETGAKDGSGDGATWAQHTLYLQDMTNPSSPIETLEGPLRDSGFKDWNRTCKAIRILEPEHTYRIYGQQENSGPAVVNTNLIGVIQQEV